MVGSRRSSLNHGLSLKAQYEAALHDLTDLVDTAQDKMAADQKMTVASVIEVQMLLDKHKVRRVVKTQLWSFSSTEKRGCSLTLTLCFPMCCSAPGVLSGSGMSHDPHPDILQ